MTVGSTQRFYVVAKVGEARAGAGAGAGAGACACGGACALVWQCAWQVGAALMARLGPAPHYLPNDNTTKDYGKVCSAPRNCKLVPVRSTPFQRVQTRPRSRRLNVIALSVKTSSSKRGSVRSDAVLCAAVKNIDCDVKQCQYIKVY